MGFFDPPSVKELRKQAEYIGAMHGQVHLGQLSAADVADIVSSGSWKAKLRDAYLAASADVGEPKARKAAVKAANLGADSYARLGEGRYQHVVQEAEQNVLGMLAG